MTIELIETRDQLQVLEDSTEIIELITQGEQGVGIAEGNRGVIAIPANLTDWTLNDNVITSSKIVNGTIVNADINDNAAIALTKLATGALPTAITVTSANISDLSIVNADINATAAIQGTKIFPNFGSQNVVTTGTLGSGDVTITSALPKISLTDSGDNPDYELQNNSGQFRIRDTTNNTNRIEIAANGTVTIPQNLNAEAGIDVTGNITVTGTVDGRDVATDGTKLDGIETGATADQTKSDIDALGIAASTAATLLNARTIAGTSFDGSANIDISYTNLTNKLSVGDGGLTQNNFTNALKTKLDGIETAATADQTAADILSLLSDQHITTTGQFRATGSGGVSGLKIANAHDSAALFFETNNNNSDFFITYSGTGGAEIKLGYDGKITLSHGSTTRIETTTAGATITGNLAVTGTVDGVDIAALNTTVGNLSLSGSVLADGTTATTQSASDNSTKVATTAYTDTAISNLVNSAPSTLDTLKELSDALGSDPNFATTVTNSIATKLPLAGGTITGNLTISSTQPQIFLTDTNNNSDYRVQNANGTFGIRDETNSTNRLRIQSDGTVIITNNLDVGAGVDITGNITVTGTVDGRDLATDGTKLDGIESNATADQTASEIVALVADQTIAPSTIDMEDNEKILLGTGDDLEIYHDGSLSHLQNNSGHFVNDIAGHFYVRNLDGAKTRILAKGNAEVELYYDGSKKFETKSDGVDITGELQCDSLDVDGGATFTTGSGNFVNFFGASNHASWDYSNSRFLFDDNAKAVFGNSADLQIYHDGSHSYLKDSGTGSLIVNTSELIIANAGNTENIFKAAENGAIELYYDNSKKLETTSSGTTISGNLLANTASGRSTELHSSGIGIIRDSKSLDLNANYAGANTHSQINSTNTQLRLGISNSDTLRVTADSIILTDNKKAIFGTGSDLEIFHDGTHSRIKDTGTGGLILSSNQFQVTNAAVTENLIKGFENGAVELYYDNSKKLETTTNGTEITGQLQVLFNGATASSIDGTVDIRSVGGSSLLVGSTNAQGAIVKIDGGANGDGAAGDYVRIWHSSNGICYFDNLHTAREITFRQRGAVEVLKIISGGNVQLPIDNQKLQIGAGQDLEIYHDGSNSRIHNSTGALIHRTPSYYHWYNSDGTETLAQFVVNGACNLYYDNSKKLETTSSGITVTGDITVGTAQILGNGNILLADNDKIKIGTGEDLQIYHDGSSSYIDNTTGSIVLRNNVGGGTSAIQIQGKSGESSILAYPDGAVNLYYDNSLKFFTNSIGARIDTILTLYGDAGNPARLRLQEGGALCEIMVARNTDSSSFLYFKNEIGGTVDTRVVIDGSGHLRPYVDSTYDLGITGTKWRNVYADTYYGDGSNLTGITSTADLVTDTSPQLGGDLQSNGNDIRFADGDRAFFGTGGDLQIFHNGSNSFITDSGTGDLYFRGDNSFIVQSSTGENKLKATSDGQVLLYYDDVKKFETLSYGAKVTGSLTATNNINNESDTGKLMLGAANDLQLYHDGSHSVIDNLTGGLFIKGGDASNGITLQNRSGNESMAKFLPNGAVELYYDNSKKFETKTFGIQLQGSAYTDNGDFHVADNGKLKAGNSSDLQIYHDGTSSIIKNNTGGLYVQSDDTRIVNAANSETIARFIADGAVELYHNSSKKFETTSTGVTVTGDVNITDDLVINSGNAEQILRDWTNNSDSDIYGLLSGSTFGTIVEGANNGHHVVALRDNDTSDSFAIVSGGGNYQTDSTYDTLVARFYSNGVFHMPDNNVIKLGTGNDLQIYHDGSNSYINNFTGNLILRPKSGEAGVLMVPNGSTELYYDGSKKFETYTNGCTVTGNLNAGNVDLADNAKARFGGSNDLEIYHDGSHSRITNSTGALSIQADDININNAANNEQLATFTANGAVELFYDHSKKLETTSTGVTVTGQIISDGLQMGDSDRAKFGSHDDLQIYHDGSHNRITGSTGDLNISNTGDDIQITAADDLILNVQSTENAVKCIGNGQVELYYDNTKKFETTSEGVKLNGDLDVNGNDIKSGNQIYEIVLNQRHNFKSAGNTIMNINGNGVDFQHGNNTHADNVKSQFGTSNDLQIWHDGSHTRMQHSGTGQFIIYGNDNDQVKIMKGSSEEGIVLNNNGNVELYFDNQKKFETTSKGILVEGAQANGELGRFFATGSTFQSTTLQSVASRNTTNNTYAHFKCSINGVADKLFIYDSGNVRNTNNSYGSISDISLKENIVDAGSQWNDIKNIKVRKFNFKEATDPDKKTMLGVVAQEAELVCPNLVDTEVSLQEGVEKEYKSFKYSVLYMKAIKCLQEAMAKIEVLETEVAALKAN